MAIDQSRSRRKATGGRYISLRKKRKMDHGSVPTHSKVGETKKRKDRTLGASIKNRLLSVDVANVLDPKTNRSEERRVGKECSSRWSP